MRDSTTPPARRGGHPGLHAGGPDSGICRARAEERVLAWLIQDPPAARGSAARLEACSFSCPGAICHELARRLLRAPAWADRSVGWPFGYIGLAYFDRLAATPAASEQAAPAIDMITRETAAARKQAPPVPLDLKADPRSYLGRRTRTPAPRIPAAP